SRSRTLRTTWPSFFNTIGDLPSPGHDSGLPRRVQPSRPRGARRSAPRPRGPGARNHFSARAVSRMGPGRASHRGAAGPVLRSGRPRGLAPAGGERPFVAPIHHVARCDECVELLVDYISGELPPARARALEIHLDLCPSCVSFVNTYRNTVNMA